MIIRENGSNLIIVYGDGSRHVAPKIGVGAWQAEDPLILPKPDITVSSITHNSATVTIEPAGGITPTSWQSQVSVSPAFTGAIQRTSKTSTFPLNEDTQYHARGRAGFGEFWSEWSDTVTFTTSSAPSSGFQWPFNPNQITTEWEGYPGHKGVDWGFAGVADQPIRAAQGGIVERAGWYSADLWGWGNMAEINHGAIGVGGAVLRTVYAHMRDTPLVSVSQAVTKNQVLGYVGTTGDSTGPHLHWETSVNGTWNQINPRTFMAQYGE